MSNMLMHYGGDDLTATATYCKMVDTFFDCMNVRGTSEHIHICKDMLAPYTSIDDARFDSLENKFLEYLSNWRDSTINRVGNFTVNACSKMFISWQTYEGFKSPHIPFLKQ